MLNKWFPLIYGNDGEHDWTHAFAAVKGSALLRMIEMDSTSLSCSVSWKNN